MMMRTLIFLFMMIKKLKMVMIIFDDFHMIYDMSDDSDDDER